jgi:hypothetical protein
MEKLRNRLVNGRGGRRQNNETEGALVVLRFIFDEEGDVMVKRGFPRSHAMTAHAAVRRFS